MFWLHALLMLALVLGCVTADLDTRRGPVFLHQKEASQVIKRQKRANVGTEENDLAPSLERECLEEVCNYEEAREVFQDTYRTDIFWSVYIDGDQCVDQPCKNGAMCSDSVGGYDCICKSGFSGVHCEKDETVCIIDKTKGCSQFCKPGYHSHECSCAHGWKLQDKDRCVPAGPHPCGKVSSLSQWDKRQSNNVQSGYQGLACNAEECPWQALLRSTGSKGFCSGVILSHNQVLTTAQCAKMFSDFQVVVGKRLPSFEAGEQTLYVKHVYVHPLYVEGKPDNDLAVLDLRDRIIFKKSVLPACLPERDFADSVLMSGEYMAVVTGWKDADEFEGNLLLNHFSYSTLPDCLNRHSSQVTNKMACTMPSAKADCVFSSGSPVLTLHRDVFFLTGVVSHQEGSDCKNGYIFQKVSRFLPWLKPLMDSTRA